MISDTLAILLSFLVCVILAVRPQLLGLGRFVAHIGVERVRLLAFCLFLLLATLILDTGNTIPLR